MEEKYKEIITLQSRTITIMFVVILLLIVALFLSHCEKANPFTANDDNLPMGCGIVMEPGLHEITARRILKRDGNISKGQKLFKQNCASCHSVDSKKIIGPGLQDVLNRVPKPAEKWIKNYILNNEKVRASGDAYAAKIFNENEKQEMTIFEGVLSEQEVDDIIFYMVAADSPID